MTRLFIFLTLISVWMTSCSPKALQPAESSTINDEIGRIENNLQPFLQFEGEQVPTFSIADRLAYYSVPNVSVALIEGGRIRWAKGYGSADPEAGRLVDEQTLFQAASISKPVAAMGILKLVQEGTLDLDTDVNEYLTSWKVPDSKFTKEQKVTLRGLLTHSAGVNIHGFPGYTQTDDFPSDIEVLNGAGNTGAIYVDTFPRTINRYSGGGYTIMERVIEDVTGQDFADYMQATVLAPIGMRSSTYEQPLPTERQSKVSVAYDASGEMYVGKWHNYPEQAAAGLWTNPSDLARFAMSIQKALEGADGALLRPSMAEQMLTKDKLGHGLGPALSGKNDSLIFRHGGKNAGFTCHLLAYAYQGKGLVVMSGADGAGPLIKEIEMAIAREYGWNIFSPRKVKTIQQSEEVLKARVGTYLLSEEDYKVYVILRAGELIIVDPNAGNKEYPLRSTTTSDMIDIVDGDKITFLADASGVVTGLKQNDYYLLEKIN